MTDNNVANRKPIRPKARWFHHDTTFPFLQGFLALGMMVIWGTSGSDYADSLPWWGRILFLVGYGFVFMGILDWGVSRVIVRVGMDTRYLVNAPDKEVAWSADQSGYVLRDRTWGSGR